MERLRFTAPAERAVARGSFVQQCLWNLLYLFLRPGGLAHGHSHLSLLLKHTQHGFVLEDDPEVLVDPEFSQ